MSQTGDRAGTGLVTVPAAADARVQREAAELRAIGYRAFTWPPSVSREP
jgi:hypothetical protein